MKTGIEYLKTLLENPVESDKADYKSAIEFKEDTDFSTKLVKHILGFANSGGGYIVIGFHEPNADKKLSIDPNFSEAIISSYEVTRLCQLVNSILGNQDRIDLTIAKIDHAGKTFPIISIAPFKRRPFFCKRTRELKNKEVCLKEGAIYIRVPGAQTVEVAGAGDWDRLISQCVEAEYETFLKRAKDVLSEGFSFEKINLEKNSDVLVELKSVQEKFWDKIK